MSRDNGIADLAVKAAGMQVAQSDWLPHARFMPDPLTAPEKAAIAASLHFVPANKSLNKIRLAFGSAAVAVAVAVPNLSLDAMVGAIGDTSFGRGTATPKVEGGVNKSVSANFAPAGIAPSAKSFASRRPVTALLYAEPLDEQDASLTFGSFPQLSDFDRELPVAVLNSGSQQFDLAFASVAMPSTLTALVPPGRPDGPFPVTRARSSAIATRTVAIDQITGLDAVVRATPENVSPQNAGPQNARPTGQSLALSSSSARTDAIASRSVEAAFAGAIDASAAVRGSLPVAPDRRPASLPQGNQEVRRAIPVGAPPAEVSGAAAVQAMLVPKTKLDARVNGVLTGSVDFQQRDGTIAIRLRSVANMMREQFSKTEFSAITQGAAIDSFVTLAQLQAAGIPVSYNPAYDEVEFGIDYKDAPNAKKVQVDQISVPTFGSVLTAIEQIPR